MYIAPAHFIGLIGIISGISNHLLTTNLGQVDDNWTMVTLYPMPCNFKMTQLMAQTRDKHIVKRTVKFADIKI